MASRISTMLEALFELLFKLSMLALAAMMLVVVCDVTSRYLFNHPIRGAYDLVETLLPVTIFFGLPAVVAGRHDIVIDLIDAIMPHGLRRVLIGASSLLGLVMLCFVEWAMWGPAQQAYRYGDVKLELNMPVWILWIPAFLGIGATILAALKVLLDVIAGNSKDAARDEGTKFE
ncbi:TRAP transporter small permease [Roseibium litorale]|uniref:TRAP transporter small permease protein n=1 Tax=Roseibium litorale TaxID=2803841 RepID=A0ABR9CRH3_9HYPH|nr:TRAP transporter small permease [Roseibium litorale]MBD8893388.1 TRAP transporter small permease [Roseibium litorale]